MSKDSLVRIHVIVCAYESSSFLAIFAANSPRNFVHSSPRPPFVPKTRGVNDPFSTSKILCIYSLRFAFSCCLNTFSVGNPDWELELTWVMRTSKNAVWPLVQKLLALNKNYKIIGFPWVIFQTLRNPPSSNITQFNFFSPQIIFKYPIQSVCEFSNPLKHFKRPKIQKNPFCSLPPFFLLLKYYPSLSTLITLYWIQLLKSNKNQNKIQLIINQFQFIHCWYSDCSDLQSN